MGMTIDDSERYLRLMLGGMEYAVRYWEDRDKEESNIEQTNVEAVKTALDTMRKYQMMQADYEARLKADLKAILVELQLEIEELKSYESVDGQDLVMLADIGILFDQKINSLKEQEDVTKEEKSWECSVKELKERNQQITLI